MRRALLVLVLASGVAHANPSRCRDLPARTADKLPADALRRFPAAADWASRERPWPKLLVDVDLDRAPHIAREILADCPGVTFAQAPASIDPRNFRSTVVVRVTSFAALTRIAQLPAVATLRITDPTIRIKHPLPEPEGDPIFDLE